MFKVLFSLYLIIMPLEIIAADNKIVNPKVMLETEKGDIVIELYPAKAPVTVDSFIKHVNNYHYDGLIFHRVIKNFMILCLSKWKSHLDQTSQRPSRKWWSSMYQSPKPQKKADVDLAGL